MTRRQSPDAESLILSAPSPAVASAQTGLTRSRASQVRTAAGISTRTGRPSNPTSTRSLQSLGARLQESADALGIAADVLLQRMHASVNAGCAMVGCDRAATHVDYQHGDAVEALYTCEADAGRDAKEMRRGALPANAPLTANPDVLTANSGRAGRGVGA